MRRRIVRFINEHVLPGGCVVCGGQATGEGPLGRPMCAEHSKAAWDSLPEVRDD